MTAKPTPLLIARLLSRRNPTAREVAYCRLNELSSSDASDVLAADAAMLYANAPPPSMIIIMGIVVGSGIALFPFITSTGDLGSIALVQLVILGIWVAINRLQHHKYHTLVQAVALELAKREDTRAVKSLLHVWQPNASPKHKHASDVERELARLLPAIAAGNQCHLGETAKEQLRAKLRGLYPARLQGVHMPHHDLSNNCVDVVVTLVQVLARSSNAKDQAIASRIAGSLATTENQRFVREAARACLNLPLIESCLSLTSSVTPVVIVNQALSTPPVAPNIPATQTITNGHGNH